LSLAPKWTKPGMILGLRIGLLGLRCQCFLAEKQALNRMDLEFMRAEIEVYQKELDRIALMKD
jgi:uncharacterized membrane-anchored protein YhcB (DUF1043 family)